MAYATEWDKAGERFFETGVDHGVLYLYNKTGKTGSDGNTYNYCDGVAWNGLTAVNHSPEGADANDTYADNIKYLTLRAAETFGFTIEALYSPAEFDECDGLINAIPGVTVGQQNRKMFGFCHRSNVGSDTDGMEMGYKYHLIWGCTASPSEHNYETVNDSPEPNSLSWEVDTIPVDIGTLTINGESVTFKPTAKITIDTTQLENGTSNEQLLALLDILYGTVTPSETEGEDDVVVKGCLPTPAQVIEIMSAQG